MKETSTGTYSLINTFSVDDPMEFTAVATDLTMTEGLHYFFNYRSINSVNPSEDSHETNVALINYPTTPTLPAKVD